MAKCGIFGIKTLKCLIWLIHKLSPECQVRFDDLDPILQIPPLVITLWVSHCWSTPSGQKHDHEEMLNIRVLWFGFPYYIRRCLVVFNSPLKAILNLLNAVFPSIGGDRLVGFKGQRRPIAFPHFPSSKHIIQSGFGNSGWSFNSNKWNEKRARKFNNLPKQFGYYLSKRCSERIEEFN